jgi:hypothetical protein
MKAMRIAVAVAVVSSLITLSAPAGLFDVKLKVNRYRSNGETLDVTSLGAVDFTSQCTNDPSATLVAVFDTFQSNLTAIVTVDDCGNILCTNLVLTGLCFQDGGAVKGAVASVQVAATIQLDSPDAVLSGATFLLGKTTVNTNGTVITLSVKGNTTLCSTNGDVYTGTIAISGPFKPGKSCP